MEYFALPHEWLLFVIGILFLALVILPVLAIMNILKHNFRGHNKTVWLVVVFVLPVAGPLSYFVARFFWKVFRR